MGELLPSFGIANWTLVLLNTGMKSDVLIAPLLLNELAWDQSLEVYKIESAQMYILDKYVSFIK